MANVAAVSQLMETAGVPATQAASPSTTTPTSSFATAMQQANTDAGVPAAPVGRKAPAKETAAAQNDTAQNDASQADASQAAGNTEATESANPSSAKAGKPLAAVVTPQTSLRYTPANMLAAMLNHSGAATASNAAIAARTASTIVSPAPLTAAGATSAALPSAAVSSSPASTSAAAQSAAPALPTATDATPGADASASKPIALPIAPATAAAKSAKAEGSPTSVRSTAKQDAAGKTSEPVGTSLPTADVAPVTVSSALATAVPATETGATPAAPLLVADAANATPVGVVTGKTPLAAQPVPASAMALPAQQPASSTSSTSSAILRSASGLVTDTVPDQPNAATFEQSLALQTSAPAGDPLPASVTTAGEAQRPFTAPADKLPDVPVTDAATSSAAQAKTPPPTQPSSSVKMAAKQEAIAATDAPATPVPPVSTTARAIVAAVTLPAAASASQPTVAPPAQPQASGTHKAVAKPSLSAADAVPSVAAAPQAAVQPAASSASPADGKPAPHPGSPAVSASAPAVVPDASGSVAAGLPIAHTPVAVTALSNPTGPSLSSPSIPASSITMTTGATDSLPHTTLSSTPTSLEVGVSSGTHGWLKIRAELNASGTVDASLTGANAAATGKLHNDLPALSSFLQEERVALGSLNVAAPGAAISALHAAGATLEPVSAFTRSAAEGVGATGTAVASDAGASGGRAPHQEAQQPGQSSLGNLREDDGLRGAVTSPAGTVPALYGDTNDLGNLGALASGSYNGGGSWLNVRV